MKALPLLALLSLPAAADPAGWVNFLRQQQVDSGLVWDRPVAATGQSPSALALQDGGALFQLWTLRENDAAEFLLDQKLVGAYLPAASIRITTGDPYPHVPRTRADQPFQVAIEVEGLLSGPNLPLAATRVLLEHHLAPYPAGANSIDARVATGGTPHGSGTINQNGPATLDIPSSSLPAADPTKALGEEHFVIHALADGSLPQSQLAAAHVQIWPVAEGRIVGLAPGGVVRHSVPAIEMHLDDLYPSSTTYLQIYPGAPRLGTDGVRVDGSVLVLDQDHGADRILRLDNWGGVLTEDGEHTMEIITVTPFGVERLTHLSFEVDRELAVNGHLGTIR